MSRPSVLFMCVHNAGRSQMAAGYLRAFAGDRIEVRSAGSQPAQHVNPVAVQAMAEDGIDITAPSPGPSPRKLGDPAGLDLEAVRPIRDDIKQRVHTLVAELLDHPQR